ncbi:AMP-binding protein [Streptomyces sp. M19]
MPGNRHRPCCSRYPLPPCGRSPRRASRPGHTACGHAARARPPHPGKVAFADDRRSVTYAELETRTRRLAGHLVRLGLGRGDRVALCLGNSVAMVERYLAVVRAGGVGVPVNPQSAPAELEYLLADSGRVSSSPGRAARRRSREASSTART